jgi:hypothetical protein
MNTRQQRTMAMTTLALGAAATLALALAPSGAARVQAQRGGVSPCTIAGDKTVAPARVPLGYAADVTLRVRATCPFTTGLMPLHVALVLDGSASMAGSRLADEQAMAKHFVAGMAPDWAANRQATVVNQLGQTLCSLSGETAALNACIDRLTATGDSDLAAGIRAGQRELMKGWPHGGSGAGIADVLFIVSGSTTNGTCPAALQAAAQAKSQGMLIFAVAFMPGADTVCLRQVASSSRYYRQATDLAGLNAAADDLLAALQPLTAPGGVRFTITDVFPKNMVPIPGSAAPAPDRVYGDLTTYAWSVWVGAGVEQVITYKVVPQALGLHVTNVQAEAILTDKNGATASFTFPQPQVEVVDATGLPTPTPFPTATPTPGPSPTPSPTPRIPLECPGLGRLVPAPVIADALANPDKVGGWLAPCAPSLPPGPANPPKMRLSLRQVSKPYHPLFNGLVYKCGCP